MAKKQAGKAAPKSTAKAKASESPAIDREQALAVLKLGPAGLAEWRSLVGAKNSVDLSEADLRGAKLNEYFLENVSLNGADLSKAQLKETRLGRVENAVLDGAKLAGATVRGLERCSLKKADLAQVRLIGEKGERPTLAGADASFAKLTGATSPDLVADGLIAEQAILDEAIFERSSFRKANFRGARFLGAEFYDCDFHEADFSEADLSGAIFARCRFIGANLSQAKLVDANLAQSDLTDATVTGADFSRTALGGAILSGVQMATAQRFEPLSGAPESSTPPTTKHLDALAEATGKLTSAQSSITVQLPNGGRVELAWKTTSRGADSHWTWYREKHTRKPKTRPALGSSLKEQLCFLGDLWRGAGRLAGETAECHKSGSEVNNPTFERLVLRGWFDAFGVDVDSPAALERFDVFVNGLAPSVDLRKLQKALQMLQADRFQLFNEVDEQYVAGVVKSQTNDETLYACRLTSEGRFACCDQELAPCMGMGVGEKKEICKHILVLVLGLSRTDRLSRPRAVSWVETAKKKAAGKGSVDENLMSEILLRYKGVELGEVDWRPMETTPEDFYTF